MLRTAGDPGPVSVVVHDTGRATPLPALLEALSKQVYRDFEVIVVTGPDAPEGEDPTEGRWPLKLIHCSSNGRSAANNAGLRAAAGPLMAFIDQGALPGSAWLAELVDALRDPAIDGAGGLVYETDGFALRSRCCSTDRLGRIDSSSPHRPVPGSDRVVFLPGTNACYRRSALEAVHGFDETFADDYHDVDLGLRMADAGLRLEAVDGARVIHAESEAFEGEGERTLTRLRARAIFAWRHGVPLYGEHAVRGDLRRNLRREVLLTLAGPVGRRMTLRQYLRFVSSALAALAEEPRAAPAGAPTSYPPTRCEGPFRPFVDSGDPGGLRICFLSQDLPFEPGSIVDVHGVARHTLDLAHGFARAGHEVHLITGSSGSSSVTWENGVWMHRLAANHPTGLTSTRIADPPLESILARAVSCWQEVRRIRAFGRLDVVASSMFRAEALVCGLDPGLRVIWTVQTPVSKIAALHPSLRADRYIAALMRTEEAGLSRADNLHVLSAAVLREVQGLLDGRAAVHLAPLGVRDRLEVGRARARDETPVGILFVGRLEPRKGVDVLFEAFERLFMRCPAARLTVVGQEMQHTELGMTYREAFEYRAREVPALADAVSFLGVVEDDRLAGLYSASQVVCTPSRFESFGLVNVEAMSFGKPAVTTSAGGPAEIVRDGIDGLLVEPGDPVALAVALEKMLSDTELRRRMGEAARRRFEERYELSVVVGRLAAVYEDVARSDLLDPRPLNDKLEEVLVSLRVSVGCDGAEVATQLLDDKRHPVDFVQAMGELRFSTDRQLLDQLHELLLGRPPSIEVKLRYRPTLLWGRRADVVRGLATTPEAVTRWGEPAWLSEAERLHWPGRTRRLARRARMHLPDMRATTPR